MMSMQLRPFFSALVIAAAAVGCAGKTPTAGEPTSGAGEPSSASVELTYALGHSHRSLEMVSRPEGVTGRITLERAIVKESRVDPKRFADYFHKISAFLASHP